MQKSYQANAKPTNDKPTEKKGYAYNKGFVKWRVNGFDWNFCAIFEVSASIES